MRKLKSICRLAMVAIGFASVFSCSHDSVDCPSEKEQVPILISDYSRIQTRVSGSSFEEGDKIGLYVLEQPFTLSDERHVDNVSFLFQNDGWVGESKIYYPSTAGLCDFIAYYPYESAGLPAASSVYTLSVETDQSSKENYGKSDFLVAEKLDVTPSVEAVPLVFKHKLIEVVIELVPGTAYDSVDELLAESPEVIIKEAATEVSYDFVSGEFAEEKSKKEIKPFGTFINKEGKLTGVSAILVPQTVSANKVFIEVKVGDRTYGFTFGENHSLASSTRETYTLTIRKNGSLEGIIESTIEDWENETSIIGDLTEAEDTSNKPKNYEVSLPDFSSSSVYKVMNEDKLLAEICREYLKGGNINNQAIVIYPVIGESIDYTNGFVVQVLDGHAGNPLSESFHGGSICWNTQSNTFIYEVGNSPTITKVYINKEGEVSSSELLNSKSASLIADLIEDERENQKYPIVKIGTQYWMQENLKATTLRGSGTLTNGAEASVWSTIQKAASIVTPAYCIDGYDKSLLYNYAAVHSGDLAPEGWSIPSSTDWNKLKEYTNDPTTLISSNWQTGNNLSGFSVEGYGYRSKSAEYVTVQKAYFWAITNVYYEITETVNVSYRNAITDGVNVRCIRD